MSQIPSPYSRPPPASAPLPGALPNPSSCATIRADPHIVGLDARPAAQVFAATEEGNAAALSELLGRLSVSPDTLGEDGDTALHVACLYGEAPAC